MRPKKIRLVCCDSKPRLFKPQGKLSSKSTSVLLSLDEFEAIRLLDKEKLNQNEVARRMKIHRSTVSRIASSGREKIAQALVDRQSIKIEGGCCQIVKGE